MGRSIRWSLSSDDAILWEGFVGWSWKYECEAQIIFIIKLYENGLTIYIHEQLSLHAFIVSSQLINHG